MFNPFMAFRQRNILGLGDQPDAYVPPTPSPAMGSAVPNLPVTTGGFDPSQMGTPVPPPTFQKPRGYAQDLTDLQSTNGPAIAAYKQYLGTQPNRDDFKPSIGRRIMAGVSGFAAGAKSPGEGIKVASEINNSPYADALQDYQLKGSGLKERATLEGDELNSKIKALQDARAMGLKYDEFQLSQSKESREAAIARQNADANTSRAQTAAQLANNPDYVGTPQQDGSILYSNRKNPSSPPIKVKGNNVQSGELGVARQNAGTNVRNANTNAARIPIEQENADTNKERQGTYQQSVTSRTAQESKPPSPRVQQDAEDGALRQMMTDPLFKKYIAKDDKGFPVVSDDDGSLDYQDFMSALDAKTKAILKGSNRRGGK